MKLQLRVLLTGWASEEMRTLESLLSGQSRYAVTTHWVDAGGSTASTEIWKQADVIVLNLGDDPQQQLKTLPPTPDGRLFVIGPADDATLLRMTLRLGARDYLERPIRGEDIMAALRQLAREQTKTGGTNQIVGIVSAKGGSGGSFLAAHLGQLLAVQRQRQTALLDFDFQFGSQALIHDVVYEHSISALLSNANHTDAVALQGYMAKHKTGVHLIGEKLDHLVLPGDISAESITALLRVANQVYDVVLVDLPRIIDPVFSAAVNQMNTIVVVLQQTLNHVRDANRLLMLLHEELEFPKENIVVAVNRYTDKVTVDMSAIQETLKHTRVVTIASDYKKAVALSDTAGSLTELASNSLLTRGVAQLADEIWGKEAEKRPFFKRALGGLFGGL